jgi:hypothetical protein
LLNLLRSVLLKVMAFVGISFITWSGTTAWHMSCQSSWFEAWNTVNSSSCLHGKCLPLILIHWIHETRTYSSGLWIMQGTSISVYSKTSIKVPLNLVWVPVFHEPIHHFKANDFMGKGQQIVIDCNLLWLK